ncbi:MAG TPA: hypothetical protein VIA64_13140 [Burkholderiales bacterium]|jgi:hypothetical protein
MRCWYFALLIFSSWLLPAPALAVLPSFDDFFREVSECRLDMGRYGELVDPRRDGVLISLPAAGAVRGMLISAFYFAPAGSEGAEEYGLLINAPLEAVERTFPEFAGRHTVNGHVRRLARLSEQTGDRSAGRQTLLMCVAGTAV